MNPISPKKLLHTKWTATNVIDQQKHFLVTKILPQVATSAKQAVESNSVDHIEIEAVYSNKTRVVPWRELQDESLWLQGWR